MNMNNLNIIHPQSQSDNDCDIFANIHRS